MRAKERQDCRLPSFHRCHMEEQKKVVGQRQRRAPPLKKKCKDQKQPLRRRPRAESKMRGGQNVKKKKRSPVTTGRMKESRQKKVDPIQPNSEHPLGEEMCDHGHGG